MYSETTFLFVFSRVGKKKLFTFFFFKYFLRTGCEKLFYLKDFLSFILFASGQFPWSYCLRNFFFTLLACNQQDTHIIYAQPFTCCLGNNQKIPRREEKSVTSFCPAARIHFDIILTRILIFETKKSCLMWENDTRPDEIYIAISAIQISFVFINLLQKFQTFCAALSNQINSKSVETKRNTLISFDEKNPVGLLYTSSRVPSIQFCF